MNDFLVYAYFVPGEELPFYIGKGKPDRPQHHLLPSNLAKKTYFYNKLNKLLRSGTWPIIKTIMSDLSEQQAFDLEISLIKIYGRRDQGTGCLYNMTDGGSGIPNLSVPYEHTIDTRVKMANRTITPATRVAFRKGKLGIQNKPVESFNLKTGETIKRYETIRDAKKDGYDQSSITKVCKGLRKSLGYMGWRYAS